MKKINVALVGLGFGGAFAGIYKDHPNIGRLVLFDTNADLTKRTSEYIGGAEIVDSFESILRDKDIDAVHLVTPIPDHAEMTVKVLESGKHCACTVPMATSLEDIQKIVDTTRKTGLNYMMMETTLYTYQFLYASEMKEKGEFGRIQFLRGSHYPDMEGWPWYWLGLPPMWYGTHAIAPMVKLSDSRIMRVSCLGSGTMREELHKQYGNPFPVETAHFTFENGLKGEATRSLFETSRIYQEGMFVYGSDACFEWGFADGDLPYVTTIETLADGNRGRRASYKITEMPSYYDRLPEEIWKYTVGGNFDPLNPQKSLLKGAGGGHHGSHPHLVHEFIMSIIEGRKPAIDENLAANITGAGVCAHISAMKDGEPVYIPEF